MNGVDFLADTNAVIYLLSGNQCMLPYISSRLAISAISFMELLSFPMISEDEEKVIREFLQTCEMILLSNDVMEQTIQIRKSFKTKLPDAIIAATAIESGLPLLTADTGFAKIDGLKLVALEP